MQNVLAFFIRLFAGGTLLLCAHTSPGQTSQNLPDGVNDETPFRYEGPSGYGSQYNPAAKFGEIILPRDYVPFTLEAEVENIYHDPAVPLWKVGFTHTWDANETRERYVFSTNSGYLYNGTGYSPSGVSPLYPEKITPAVIQNVIGPRIVNSDIIVHDYEIGYPTPEELARPGFVPAWIYATMTGPLGYARARGQRTAVYGGSLMGGTKFDDNIPWADGFGTDWRVWQKRSYGVEARDNLFWAYDAYGVRPREVVTFPRVSDIQPLSNFIIFYQRTGSSPGAPYYPLGIIQQDPSVAATGLVSSTTIPTRYRLEELPGKCGDGSRTFRFTLEDEAGNRVDNWVAAGWIPDTQIIAAAQLDTDSKPPGSKHANRIPDKDKGKGSPSIQAVETVIPAPRAGVNFQTANGGSYGQRLFATTFTQGSAVATVCIVNDIPGGNPPVIRDIIEECDEAILKMWGQSVHSRKLEPTLIPWHTVSPLPHLHNDVGFTATGTYPEHYLPALILHAANQQAGVTLWGHTMFTENTKFANGRTLDNIIAARKRVKLREALAFSPQTVRPDYALRWNGVDVWTKNTQFAPNDGDPDRYDPIWIYRMGANAGNNQYVNHGNRYTIPVPLISVCQNGNKVWIVGTMIGKVEPNVTNTYTVKVRPVGNESQVKAYSITLTGKKTTSVTYTLDFSTSCNLTATASAGAGSCGASSSLTASVQGGNGAALSYAWSGPNGFSSTLASPQLSNLSSAMAGTYSLTLSQSGGCSATASTTLSFTCPTPPAPPVGSGCALTKVRIYPRPDCCGGRTIGARIQVSTSGPSGPWQTVLSIPSESANQWNEFSISGASGSYKALRYVSATVGHTNVAEVEFYNGATKLTGTAFGDASGAWNGSSNTFHKALDGNVATYYDANDPNNGYVGLTLNACEGTTPPPPGCNLTATASAGAGSCGASSSLTASVQGGNGAALSYAWSGPNGFSSTLASPQLSNLSSAMAGTYSLTLSQSGGCSATASTTLSFTCPTPPAPPVGSGCALTKVRIYPRPDCCGGRTIGARIQVSTSGPSGPWQTVLSIPSESANQWNEFSISGASGSYKALRYVSATVGHTNVAEVEFYNGATKLTGTAFGDASGAWNGSSNTFHKALDGNVATYYDANDPNNGYVGLTLNACEGTTPPPPGCNLTATASAGAGSCGASSSLTASVQGGNGAALSYAWSGPNGFSSTLASPQLSNLSSAMAGTYSLTLSQSGGCSATASTTLSFTCPTPPAPPVGSGCALTKVRIYPRPDCCGGRTIGARIQVSTSGPSGPWQTVLSIPSESANQWNEFSISGASGSYKALRYVSATVGHTNVAEVEFYNGATKLTGTAFGDASGAWNGSSNTFHKALDGNVATYYDANDPNNGYVGLTLNACGGATRQAAEVKLAVEEMPFAVTVNPNPSSGRAKVHVNLPEAGLVSCSVLSPAGQELITQERNGQVGENIFEVDYRHCPNGLYLLRVQSQGRKSVLKLIKIQE